MRYHSLSLISLTLTFSLCLRLLAKLTMPRRICAVIQENCARGHSSLQGSHHPDVKQGEHFQTCLGKWTLLMPMTSLHKRSFRLKIAEQASAACH